MGVVCSPVWQHVSVFLYFVIPLCAGGASGGGPLVQIKFAAAWARPGAGPGPGLVRVYFIHMYTYEYMYTYAYMYIHIHILTYVQCISRFASQFHFFSQEILCFVFLVLCFLPVLFWYLKFSWKDEFSLDHCGTCFFAAPSASYSKDATWPR